MRERWQRILLVAAYEDVVEIVVSCCVVCCNDVVEDFSPLFVAADIIATVLLSIINIYLVHSIFLPQDCVYTV